ncbi:MAG: ABC transporter permease [Candidatus Helarchaeota archaeon]
MLERIRRIYNKTLAITEKELKLELRFRLQFFYNIFVLPFLALIPFVILYGGVFSDQGSYINSLLSIFLADKAGETEIYYYLIYNFIQQNYISTFNQNNYLSWLLIGNIVHTFSKNGFDAFVSRFQIEKYWGTIQGTLLAPLNRYLLLASYIIMVLIQSFLYFLMMITISFIVYPVSFIEFIFMFFMSFLTLIAACGIGLLKGAVTLANENVRFFFELFQFFVIFFSCYSIPREYFPEFLQVFTLINPFYHGINLARDAYFGIYAPDFTFSLTYVITFAISISIIAVYLFNKIMKKYGVHGY